MTRKYIKSSFPSVFITFTLMFFLWTALPAESSLTETPPEKAEAGIKTKTNFGTGLKNHEIVGESNAFDVSDRVVYARTLVTEANHPLKIMHCWYLNGRLVATVPLHIPAKNSRTHSRKTITDMVGIWTLDVVDENGTLLETRDFVVKDRRLPFVVNGNASGEADKLNRNVYHIVFSTGKNLDDDPVNDLKEISMDEQWVYIFVACKLSDKSQHTLQTMFDGDGKIVFRSSNWICGPPNENFKYFGSFKFVKDVDTPGLWRFVMLINDEEIEDYLWVKPSMAGGITGIRDKIKIMQTWPEAGSTLIAGTTCQFIANVEYNLLEEKGAIFLGAERGDFKHPDNSYGFGSAIEPVKKGRGIITLRSQIAIPESQTLFVSIFLRGAGIELPTSKEIRVFKVGRE